MLDWLDHLRLPEGLPAPSPDPAPAITAATSPSPPAGLLAHVRRMAEFYHYTPDETAYAIEQARANPESWRAIVAASKARWGWSVGGEERHPWATVP